MPQAPLTARRDAPVGGQAVLEGVMMRGVSHWAVAVRKDGEIDVQAFPFVPWASRRRLFRVPVLRGFFALVESLKIGFRALNLSANAQQAEDAEPIAGATWVFAVVAGLSLAVGLFFVLPVTITSLIPLESATLFWLIEGGVRTAIFLAYLALLTRLPDLQRVFEYHGAEHKTIACYEAGDELIPERAALFSRLHPRCGTSFMLIVMIVAIFVFAPIGLPEWYWLLATRIVGIPLIVGLSFEVIKFAGRNRERAWVQRLMWPGMQLQRMTTRDPDREQLAVAIASLEAVLAREDPRTASAIHRVGMEVVA